MSLNLDIPDSPRLRDTLAAACLFALIVAGFGAGYWIGATRVPVAENISHAPAVRQADGSLVLQRVPDATPVPAPHSLPSGSTEVRRISTQLAPVAGKTDAGKPCNCAPITVTTSLVQDGNELRVVQSADGAEVAGGVDTAIRPLNLAPPPRVWAAEVMYEPVRERYGIRVSRDLGRLRVSASLLQRERGESFAPWIGVGLTW